jgi:transketolase
MIPINSLNVRMWSKLGSRGTLGVALYELGRIKENLTVLTSDLTNTSGLDRFKAAFPEKFLNVGIAEQNMIGIAGGMAHEGDVVFTTSFGTFASMRCYEQIRHNLGYMGLNVKVVGMASGFAMGMFGNTHYGVEDLALMRAMPGLTVLSPADGAEIIKAIEAAANYVGPVYIRLTGAMNNPIVYQQDYDFRIGKAVTLREEIGSHITIFATGTMVHESLVAADFLKEQGILASVVNMHTIKPLDTQAIDRACATAKLIVSVEEHGIIGGLGGAIAEYKAGRQSAPPQLFMGVPDAFDKSGDYKYLLGKYGLTGKQIAARIAEESSSADPKRNAHTCMSS